MRLRLSLDRDLLVVSRGGMPNHVCLDMPRGSWQRPTTRLSAALDTHVSPTSSSPAPGLAKAVHLATDTDEDESEAEASSGRWSPGAAPSVSVLIAAVRSVVGGGR
jgi:hypothetical protein